MRANPGKSHDPIHKVKSCKVSLTYQWMPILISVSNLSMKANPCKCHEPEKWILISATNLLMKANPGKFH